MCELSCVLRLWFQYHWIEIEKSHTSIETSLDDLLQVPLRAADSRLQFQQGANNLKATSSWFSFSSPSGVACWLPNHLAHCGEDLPQLLSHQRHLEVSFCMAALPKTTLSTTTTLTNYQRQLCQQKTTLTNYQRQLENNKPKQDCVVQHESQLSALGPEPTPDCFQFRLKIEVNIFTNQLSLRRERDDKHDHDKQQWVAENDLNDNNMIGRWTTKTRMDNCRLNWTWSR